MLCRLIAPTRTCRSRWRSVAPFSCGVKEAHRPMLSHYVALFWITIVKLQNAALLGIQEMRIGMIRGRRWTFISSSSPTSTSRWPTSTDARETVSGPSITSNLPKKPQKRWGRKVMMSPLEKSPPNRAALLCPSRVLLAQPLPPLDQRPPLRPRWDAFLLLKSLLQMETKSRSYFEIQMERNLGSRERFAESPPTAPPVWFTSTMATASSATSSPTSPLFPVIRIEMSGDIVKILFNVNKVIHWERLGAWLREVRHSGLPRLGLEVEGEDE